MEWLNFNLNKTMKINYINKPTYKPFKSNTLIGFRGIETLKADQFKSQRYMLAFDLDGTFLTGKKEDYDKFKDITKDKNATLVYVTGKTGNELPEVIEEYKKENIDLPLPDYFIGNNGIHVFKVDKVNNSINMVEDKTWVEKFKDFDIKKAINATLNYFENHKIDGKPVIQSTPWDESQYTQWFYFHHKYLNQIEKKLTELFKTENIPFKIIIDYVPSQFARKVAPEHLCDKEGGCYAFGISASDKADAVKHVQKQLAIKDENVIAAGNSGNDISLTIAGFCFILISDAADILKNFIKAMNPANIIAVSKEGLAGINIALQNLFDKNK